MLNRKLTTINNASSAMPTPILKLNLNKLAIREKAMITFIDYSDIIYCEADSNYTSIHLSDGSKQVVSKNLKEIESQISSSTFHRIHSGYLVNLKFIKCLFKNPDWKMKIGKSTLPISRGKIQNLKMKLNV